MNKGEFEDAVCSAFPVPDGIFERAKWMGEAADTCQVLAKSYRREEAALTLKIRSEGLTSDEYRLLELTRPFSKVNVPLLKAERPDIFEEAVHVKQAFAEKTLGRRTLYDMVADVLGATTCEAKVMSSLIGTGVAVTRR